MADEKITYSELTTLISWPGTKSQLMNYDRLPSEGLHCYKTGCESLPAMLIYVSITVSPATRDPFLSLAGEAR